MMITVYIWIWPNWRLLHSRSLCMCICGESLSIRDGVGISWVMNFIEKIACSYLQAKWLDHDTQNSMLDEHGNNLLPHPLYRHRYIEIDTQHQIKSMIKDLWAYIYLSISCLFISFLFPQRARCITSGINNSQSTNCCQGGFETSSLSYYWLSLQEMG